VIRVELRRSSQGLTDPATNITLFTPSTVLKEQFKSMPTKAVRSHHLSWEALCTTVTQDFSIDFDPCKDELGWVQVPPRPDLAQKYITITDELTFHNAIGVLYNALQLEPAPLITIYLWSPKRTDTVLRQPRRTTDVPVATAEDSERVMINERPRASSNEEEDLYTASPPRNISSMSLPDPGKDNDALSPNMNGSASASDEAALPEEQRGTSPRPDETSFDVNRLLRRELEQGLSAPVQDEDEDNDDFETRLREYQAQLAESETNKYISALCFISFELLITLNQTSVRA